MADWQPVKTSRKTAFPTSRSRSNGLSADLSSSRT